MPSANVLKNARVSGPTVNLLERQRQWSAVGPDGMPLGANARPVYSEEQMRRATHALQTQIDQLREEAAAARHHGHEEGLAKGRTSERAHLREKAERLEQLAAEILAERSRILSAASRDLAQLAVRMTERFCRQAHEANPALVLRGVEEALSSLASGERIVVRVHPADIELVKSRREELGRLLDEGSELQLRADESVRPGGCVVETPQLYVDGSVDGFLDRCSEALGTWASREDLLSEGKDVENAA